MTILCFGTLSDRSTVTSTDARATEFTTGFLEEWWSRWFCHKLVVVLATAGDVLTQ